MRNDLKESKTISLIDDRSSVDKSVYSDSDETPEKLKRPLEHLLPDDDDLHSLSSYNKPIPKKSKDVERLRQQSSLRTRRGGATPGISI